MEFKPFIKFLMILGGAILVSLAISPLIFSTLFAGFERKVVDDGCGEIWIEWDSVERASRYELYRSGELVYVGGSLWFLDRPLIMGESYIYHLKALNQGGESEFSRQTTMTAERPCPPERPEEIDIYDMPCGGYMYLEWDLVPRATVYEVARNPVPGFAGGPGDWISENIVYNGSETDFFEGGLKPGAFYSYKIRAGNDSGWGEWSSRFVKASLICSPETPSPPREI